MNGVSMTEKIKVEIWSDLICPWCCIGRTRLEQALARSPHQDRFLLKHRAFRLAPGEAVRPVETALAQKYGRNQPQVLQMLDHVEKTAAQDGLKYNLRGTLYGDTLDAHRLVLWAAEKGLEEKILNRLYKAYFSEGISIFDQKNLLDLIVPLGADRAEAKAMFDGEAYKDQVTQDEEHARQMGSQGVPFFVFAEQYAISGAQPTEVFLQAIEKLA